MSADDIKLPPMPNLSAAEDWEAAIHAGGIAAIKAAPVAAKDHPRFIAGYDAGMADARRMAASAEPVPVEIERLAINRYRPVPAGALAYKVVAGDGSRSLFSGTKDECQIVARKLTEAFLDGAHVAINAAPVAAQAQSWAPAGPLRIECDPERFGKASWHVTDGHHHAVGATPNEALNGFARYLAAQAPAANGDALTEQQALGAAIWRASSELPDGYIIELYMERDYAGAKLIYPDGDQIDLDLDERNLASEIDTGIYAAMQTTTGSER